MFSIVIVALLLEYFDEDEVIAPMAVVRYIYVYVCVRMCLYATGWICVCQSSSHQLYDVYFIVT